MGREAEPRASWSPHWATHPGEHLAEQIEARGWSQAELARVADLTPELVGAIIAGREPVTLETAIRLERAIGLKAEIWTRLQANRDRVEGRAHECDTAEAVSVHPFPIERS